MKGLRLNRWTGWAKTEIVYSIVDCMRKHRVTKRIVFVNDCGHFAVEIFSWINLPRELRNDFARVENILQGGHWW